MTNKEAIRELKIFNGTTRIRLSTNFWEALNTAIKALEVEPLTDIEQRIFLAAMSREENACKEVCADGSGDGVDLVAVCHRIERKVKRALWE